LTIGLHGQGWYGKTKPTKRLRLGEEKKRKIEEEQEQEEAEQKEEEETTGQKYNVYICYAGWP